MCPAHERGGRLSALGLVRLVSCLMLLAPLPGTSCPPPWGHRLPPAILTPTLGSSLLGLTLSCWFYGFNSPHLPWVPGANVPPPNTVLPGSGQSWGQRGEIVPGFCPSPCTPGSPVNSFPSPPLQSGRNHHYLLWEASHSLLLGSGKILHPYQDPLEKSYHWPQGNHTKIRAPRPLSTSPPQAVPCRDPCPVLPSWGWRLGQVE